MSVTISHLLFGVGGDVFDVNITGHFSVLGGFLFLVIFDIQEKVEVFFTEFFCEKFSKFTTTGLKQQTNSLVNCCLGSHYRSKCISQFENILHKSFSCFAFNAFIFKQPKSVQFSHLNLLLCFKKSLNVKGDAGFSCFCVDL